MRRREQPLEGCGSPGRPDLLRHEVSPLPPVYLSFFEEECRAIVGRLRLGTAAEPSPGLWEGSDPWPDAAGLLTSTPLRHEGTPGSGAPPAGDCEDSAALGPARGEPRHLPAAGVGPGAAPPASRLARPRKAAQRGAGQQPPGGPGPAGRPLPSGQSPGRGGGRVSVVRARGGGRALELPKAGKGLGAPGMKPPRSPGAKMKLMPAAKSRLGHPSGAWQPAQPSAIPKATPRYREAAVKVGGRRQPSQRLSTAIPTMASRSRLRPLGKAASPKRFCLASASSTQELICNRTWELKENGKADQTWVCVGSSFSSELAPGLTPGCGDAQQPAGDQLSQELKHVKNELERVKGELADKTAQCEAYRQMISSLQAQLRAAGICPEDAAVEESGDSRETDGQNMGTESQQPLVRPPELLRQ